MMRSKEAMLKRAIVKSGLRPHDKSGRRSLGIVHRADGNLMVIIGSPDGDLAVIGAKTEHETWERVYEMGRE